MPRAEGYYLRSCSQLNEGGQRGYRWHIIMWGLRRNLELLGFGFYMGASTQLDFGEHGVGCCFLMGFYIQVPGRGLRQHTQGVVVSMLSLG